MPEKFLPVLTHTAGWRSRGNLQSNLTDLCALLNIPEPISTDNKEVLFQHVHYKTGKIIHMIGQHFDHLYIVNSGFLKTVVIDDYGNEQVLGFPMRGDLLGIDAIHSKQHTTEVVALSDCDLILIPYETLSSLGRIYADFEQAMMGLMSRELVREQMTICMLSALGAEAKVARFLVSLGKRFCQLGYSGKVYNLRMTRLEIANYLGLAIETVSRTLSAFHELGLIVVYQRQIRIIDAESLATLRRLPTAKQQASATTIGLK
ncbi:MAG: helix-turn-helix domain-containing protein [Pseudomonadota bacterium]